VLSYTPASNTWSAVTPMPIAKEAHAASIAVSTIYVIGANFIRVMIRVDSTQGT
jgi:hypothetical protein